MKKMKHRRLKVYRLFVLNFLVCALSTFHCLSQNSNSQKDALLNDNLKEVIHKVDSIYKIDQDNRLAFDAVDEKYGLPENSNMVLFHLKERREALLGNRAENYLEELKSLRKKMKEQDVSNVKELIELTGKHGFPGPERLGVKKSKAYLIFVHTPNNYKDEVRLLIEEEYRAGRMGTYEYQHIIWHLDGRKGMPQRSNNRKD